MIFALVGNQNCGKTTLFNALTGSNQHVGNFPGVTVDQKMGEIRDEKGCSVVDLPGIYSLRPYTQEEIVSRDFIINQKPDGIINIVDATNIERNLYLTLQLLELRVPMVLALNMMDEVRANGGSIDVRKMSQALGIPVIPITAAKGEGVSELVDQALTVARGKILPKVTDFCSDGSAVHRCIHAVVHLIADHADRIGVPARFCAAKLIEGGDDLADQLKLDENEKELLEHCIVQMETETGLDRNAVTRYIEDRNVQTRLLFSGNLIKHPCFDQIRGTDAYRVAGELTNTDFIMNNTFWVGVYPGMTDEMIDYMAKIIIEAVNQ